MNRTNTSKSQPPIQSASAKVRRMQARAAMGENVIIAISSVLPDLSDDELVAAADAVVNKLDGKL